MKADVIDIIRTYEFEQADEKTWNHRSGNCVTFDKEYIMFINSRYILTLHIAPMMYESSRDQITQFMKNSGVVQSNQLQGSSAETTGIREI